MNSKKIRTLVCFYFRFIYNRIINNKFSALIVLLFFQLLVLMTSIGLAKADTSILYSIVTDNNFASNTDYISFYPNNFLLLIWMKLNYIFWRENFVIVLGLFNILFIDFSIYILFLLNSKCTSLRISNYSFVLGFVILGFSPQYIYTYSDSITLFFLNLFLLNFVECCQMPSFRSSIFAGLLLSITFSFRPTVMIFIIAALIVFIYHFLQKKFQYKKQFFKTLIIFVTSFLLFNRSVDFTLQNQDFVKFENEHSKTLLYFVDLGLTYSGNIHAEIPENVMNAVGSDRNRLAFEDIKNRLNNYDFTSFVGHVFYKLYWITNEGLFGWQQENVLSEGQLLQIPWLRKIQDFPFSKWIRSYVYVEGVNHYLYATSIQFVWIIIVIGLFIYSFYYSSANAYQLWMQISVFGAISFLMIFEGGRTRYLIQFLPAILTVSAIGLTKLVDLSQYLRDIRKSNNGK